MSRAPVLLSLPNLCLATVLLPALVIGQRPTEPAVRSTTSAGVFTSFYANDVVRDRGSLEANGKRTGRWQQFWPNGQLAADGTYQAGERQGEWVWRDPYGRVLETVWCGDQRHGIQPAEALLVPLRVEDLRLGLVGTTTVGALIDRYAAAGDDAAGAAERAAVARTLAGAPPEAVGVPWTIAEGLPAPQRLRWLQLIVAMPMPETMPVEQLMAWRHEPACAAAATAVLEAWSRQFAAKWQPLIARDNKDGNRLSLLYQLGPKAFGALPELRRQLADGTLSLQIGSVIAAVQGLGPHTRLGPWIAALDHADDGHRAEAVLILLMQGPPSDQPVPAATIVRLLCDPCPAVAKGAALLAQRVPPPLSPEELDRARHSPHAFVRLVAADRFHVLGRDGEAEAIWREVAVSEPEAMSAFDGWMLLARHTQDPAAVRDLLLACLAKGNVLALLAVQIVAGDDERVIAALVEQALTRAWIRGDLLSASMRRQVEERLRHLLDDPTTSSPQRCSLFENLVQVAVDDAARRAVATRCLDHADVAVRQVAMRRAAWLGVAPDAAQWVRLLTDPTTRDEAATQLAHFPLPDGFDPTPYPVGAVVFATWADGQPARTAQLIERVLAADGAALDALLILKPDLRAFEARLPKPDASAHPFWRIRARELAELLPEFAAEWRVFEALQPLETRMICPPPGQHLRQRSLLLPVDAGLIAVVQRRLLDPLPERRAEALQVLVWLGTDGRPALPALRQALPGFTAADLAKLPDVVCAIAPEAAVELCEPLLAHQDAEVVTAAMLGPSRAVAGKIPGGGAFARKVAERLAAGDSQQPSAWFAVLGDAKVALAELREGLRQHPNSGALAAALRDLGPAADAAVPELIAALPHNAMAAQALAAALPPQHRFASLLPLLDTELAATVGWLLVGVPIDDPAMLMRIEQLADDDREPVRTQARQILVTSASESAVADQARLEALRQPQRGLPLIDAKQWLRLWPQLTAAERAPWLSQLAFQPPAVLPTELGDALAAALPGDTNGLVFMALVRCAPLHAKVLERVEALTSFWNATPNRPEHALPAMHVHALLCGWKTGDDTFRTAATPWLRRHPGALSSGLESLRVRTPDRALSVLELLELHERIAHPDGFATAAHRVRDPELAVRRAALRALVACGAESSWLRTMVDACLLERTWDEQFGPLEGLPALCAELAATAPSVDERCARIRTSCVDRPDEAAGAMALDVAAARQLLPELRQLLGMRRRDHLPALLQCLRGLGPDAAALLPALEPLAAIPWLHFEVAATARILRGEAPTERWSASSGPTAPGAVPRTPRWR